MLHTVSAVMVHAHLDVTSVIAVHKLTQLRRNSAGVDVTRLSTEWSAGE